MHSNVTSKNVSWPHFSCTTLYVARSHSAEQALSQEYIAEILHALVLHTWLIRLIHAQSFPYGLLVISRGRPTSVTDGRTDGQTGIQTDRQPCQ